MHGPISCVKTISPSPFACAATCASQPKMATNSRCKPACTGASGASTSAAGSAPPRRALDANRKRWAIECLFADAKTRGLNLEDTRLSDPRKLDLLMGLVALAIAWAARAARDFLGPRWPKRKAHGYLAKSWFRTGFDQIRRLLRSDPLEAIAPWLRIALKHPKKARVV